MGHKQILYTMQVRLATKMFSDKDLSPAEGMERQLSMQRGISPKSGHASRKYNWIVRI
jgi:hypothetical protein